MQVLLIYLEYQEHSGFWLEEIKQDSSSKNPLILLHLKSGSISNLDLLQYNHPTKRTNIFHRKFVMPYKFLFCPFSETKGSKTNEEHYY